MQKMTKYPLPEKYRQMPVGYHRAEDRAVTLAEAMDAPDGFVAFDELTPDKRLNLVLSALEGRADYKIFAVDGCPDESTVTQHRAMEEVRKGSPLGQKIVQVEGNLMMTLLRRFAKFAN